jgi:rRNA small subunit pseudouridine methyltransferase Nep1
MLKLFIDMISIVLVEAGIEIPPQSIRGHPAVKNDALRRGKKPGEILLYKAKHRFAMDKLRNVDKRGRPDITHRSLLAILDSPLNRMGYLNVFVHTIEDIIISFDPKVRLPRDYYQFEGLMVQVLKKGKVPPIGDPLIEIVDIDIETFIEKHRLSILLSEDGEKYSQEIGRDIINNESIILIGAFPKGKIREDISSKVDLIVRVSDYALMTSTAICRLLTLLEGSL